MSGAMLVKIISIAAICILMVLTGLWLLNQNTQLEQEWNAKEEEWTKFEQAFEKKRQEFERQRSELSFRLGDSIFNQSAITLLPYKGQERHAVVTAIGGDEETPQWMGAVGIAQALVEVRSRIKEVIALNYSPVPLPDLALEMFDNLNIKVITINTTFLSDQLKKDRRQVLLGGWGELWARVLAYGLRDYDRVAFLDHSAVVVGNFDHLLEATAETAPLLQSHKNPPLPGRPDQPQRPVAHPQGQLGDEGGWYLSAPSPSPSVRPSPSSSPEVAAPPPVGSARPLLAGGQPLGHDVRRSCPCPHGGVDRAENWGPSEGFFVFSPRQSAVPALRAALSGKFAKNADPPTLYALLDEAKGEVEEEVALLAPSAHDLIGRCQCGLGLPLLYTRGCAYLDDPWEDVLGRAFVDPPCVGDLFVLWLRMFTKAVPIPKATILRH